MKTAKLVTATFFKSERANFAATYNLQTILLIYKSTGLMELRLFAAVEPNIQNVKCDFVLVAYLSNVKYMIAFIEPKDRKRRLQGAFRYSQEDAGKYIIRSCIEISLNKVEYTHQSVYCWIKQVLHDCSIKFRPGDPYLQRAIEETNEDESAQSGPKINTIMSLKLQ